MSQLDEQRRAFDGQGGKIRSQVPSDAYRDGWDRIFGRRKHEGRDVAAPPPAEDRR